MKFSVKKPISKGVEFHRLGKNPVAPTRALLFSSIPPNTVKTREILIFHRTAFKDSSWW